MSHERIKRPLSQKWVPTNEEFWNIVGDHFDYDPEDVVDKEIKPLFDGRKECVEQAVRAHHATRSQISLYKRTGKTIEDIKERNYRIRERIRKAESVHKANLRRIEQIRKKRISIRRDRSAFKSERRRLLQEIIKLDKKIIEKREEIKRRLEDMGIKKAMEASGLPIPKRLKHLQELIYNDDKDKDKEG